MDPISAKGSDPLTQVTLMQKAVIVISILICLISIFSYAQDKHYKEEPMN